MSESQSPFSGGSPGGNVGNPYNPSPELKSLFDLLNQKAVEKFIIDYNGNPIELTFYPASGTVDLVSSGTKVSLPYKKG